MAPYFYQEGEILANLVSEGVVDKLVQNQYLHSNTENFVEVVNQQLDSFRKTQMNNELLIKIKERLETLINKTNVQMNSFYEDISNYYSSIGQTDKVISGRDSYSNGVYTPNGANEFRSDKRIFSNVINTFIFKIKAFTSKDARRGGRNYRRGINKKDH